MATGLKIRAQITRKSRYISTNEVYSGNHTDKHRKAQTHTYMPGAVCSGSAAAHLHIILTSAARFDTSRQSKHPQAEENSSVCVSEHVAMIKCVFNKTFVMLKLI